jgi:hypothetical protein
LKELMIIMRASVPKNHHRAGRKLNARRVAASPLFQRCADILRIDDLCSKHLDIFHDMSYHRSAMWDTQDMVSSPHRHSGWMSI